MTWWPLNRQGMRSAQHLGHWGLKVCCWIVETEAKFSQKAGCDTGVWPSQMSAPWTCILMNWSVPPSVGISSIEIFEVGSCFDAQENRPAVGRVMYTIPPSVVGIRFRSTVTRCTSPLMLELKGQLCECHWRTAYRRMTGRELFPYHYTGVL